MSNFGGLEGEWTDYEKASVVLLPVGYSGTVSYGKGTEKGPQAIIKASNNLELYDEELDSEPFDAIIHTASFECKDDPEQNVNAIEATCNKFIDDDKFVIMLGGEHSITTGLVRALRKKYDDFCVLQIDAHSDLRDEYEGSRYNHACVMRRISDMNIPIVQVGIRSMCIEEKDELDKINTKIFFMNKIINNEFWMDKVVESLSKNVFITIDLDGFDPGIMPSTGTPEPGGFQWWQVVQLLRYVFKAKKVIGCDVVELAPIEGLHAPDFLAAKLVYKLIGYKYEANK